MKKNIVITIDIDVDMKNSSDWEDEDDFIEEEVKDAVREIGGMGLNSWAMYHVDSESYKLKSGTIFQYDTEFK